MRVLVAGANGAIGTPLTRRLLAHGHEVIALAHHRSGAAQLAERGATPVVADALDRDGLLSAVAGLQAEAVVHELTALRKPPRRPSGMAQTNRLRIEGTRNLVAAAQVLGADTFVTQSIIFGYGFGDHGDRVLTEDDPFGRPTGGRNDDVLAALVSTEAQAFGAPRGIALRYGLLYGGDADQERPLLAARGVPVAAGGAFGWVHHDDAAAATVAALEHGRPGQAYNVVDDEPATWRDVFVTMAQAFDAPRPRNLPRWLFRLMAPYVAGFAIDTRLHASNAKAATELGWRPAFPTYREGVAAMVDSPAGPSLDPRVEPSPAEPGA
jgi:nucleoside-diphosphate-sugar epimerase